MKPAPYVIVQSDWQLVQIPAELFPSKWDRHRACWLPPAKPTDGKAA